MRGGERSPGAFLLPPGSHSGGEAQGVEEGKGIFFVLFYIDLFLPRSIPIPQLKPPEGEVLRAVMRLPLASAASLDCSARLRALRGWLGLGMICQPAMEVEGRPGLEEGAAGKVAPKPAKGCINSRWLREPGLWLSTTPSLSNRTASQSTDPSSSSVKIMLYGNTPSE